MTNGANTSGKITMPAKEIPISMEAGVIVVGGSPSGFGAALRAARKGVQTLGPSPCELSIWLLWDRAF